MKKSIFTIFTLLFVSAFANAQITIMPYVQADFANSVSFAGSNSSAFGGAKLGYASGLAVNYAFNKKWELKSGLTFQEMGNKWESDLYVTSGVNPIDKIAERVRYQFLSVPIQLQYNFNIDKKQHLLLLWEQV